MYLHVHLQYFPNLLIVNTTSLMFSVVKPDVKLRFNRTDYEITYPNIFNKDSIYVAVINYYVLTNSSNMKTLQLVYEQKSRKKFGMNCC